MVSFANHQIEGQERNLLMYKENIFVKLNSTKPPFELIGVSYMDPFTSRSM